MVNWDLTIPGTYNIGPGNEPVYKGFIDDLTAYLHDVGYGDIIYKGDNPYLKWNQYDAEAYAQWQANPDWTWQGKVAQAFFFLKKTAADNGWIDTIPAGFTDTNTAKRKRDEEDADTLPDKKPKVREGTVDAFGNFMESATKRPRTEATPSLATLRLTGGGAAGDTGGGIGEELPKPYNITPIIQNDHTTTKHKWICTMTKATETPGDLLTQEFRCNSPLDPNISIDTAVGTGLNATFDNVNNRFNGFNELACRYRYYRVMENHIQISFYKSGKIGAAEGTVQQELIDIGRLAFPIAVGYNLNPSNRYPLNSDSITEWAQFAQARFSDWAILQGPYDSKVFSFTWKPGMWDASVDESQKEKIWTPINQHQGPDDRFMIWIQALNQTQTFWHVQVVIHMTQIIQFREWDHRIVERMFLLDEKPEPRGNATELAHGSEAVFSDPNDLPCAPGPYSTSEQEV